VHKESTTAPHVRFLALERTTQQLAQHGVSPWDMVVARPHCPDAPAQHGERSVDGDGLRHALALYTTFPGAFRPRKVHKRKYILLNPCTTWSRAVAGRHGRGGRGVLQPYQTMASCYKKDS
jgi:hypothetical protein